MNNNDILNIYENDDKENEMWQEYIDEIRKDNKEYLKRTGEKPKMHTITHGCQMNILRTIYNSHKNTQIYL